MGRISPPYKKACKRGRWRAPFSLSDFFHAVGLTSGGESCIIIRRIFRPGFSFACPLQSKRRKSEIGLSELSRISAGVPHGWPEENSVGKSESVGLKSSTGACAWRGSAGFVAFFIVIAIAIAIAFVFAKAIAIVIALAWDFWHPGLCRPRACFFRVPSFPTSLPCFRAFARSHVPFFRQKANRSVKIPSIRKTNIRKQTILKRQKQKEKNKNTKI